MTAEKTVDVESKSSAKKRATRLSQAKVPTCSLEEAMSVPRAIWDHLAGKPATPIQVCKALDLSPSSSKWRDLAGASIAYGLTSGGYNAKAIELESLGKRAVAPTEEGDDLAAIQEATCKPAILKTFFEYYENKRFPKDSIAQNMLIEWEVPQDRVDGVLNLIKENGKYARLLSEIKGSLFVTTSNLKNIPVMEGASEEIQEEIPQELLERLDLDIEKKVPSVEIAAPVNNKVFITHGKNKKMVDALKELLKYGGFEPIVAVERESTAISVPEKVFSDMRSCCAGIIHVEEERVLFNEENIPQNILNENVLIEIGAAIALYDRKMILLCKKGINLPSNLQGLYRCEYEGDKLDIDSTMKLLKTFNSFK